MAVADVLLCLAWFLCSFDCFSLAFLTFAVLLTTLEPAPRNVRTRSWMHLAISFCKLDHDDLVPGRPTVDRARREVAGVATQGHQYAGAADHLRTIAGARGARDEGQSCYIPISPSLSPPPPPLPISIPSLSLPPSLLLHLLCLSLSPLYLPLSSASHLFFPPPLCSKCRSKLL